MSLHTVLSESEREYILCGIKEGVRADGRGCRDVRHFSLRLGVVSNTSGSALIERERTSAIIGVKAELEVPHPSTPDEGRLEFHVDCSSLAGPMFERRGGEVLGQRLAEQLEEAYSSAECVDRKALSVIAGEQCWVLYVDALILEVGGSVLDTLSIGIRAALQATAVPKLTLTGEGDEIEIEVSDNPNDITPINAAGAPIIITLYQVGGEYVVDCSAHEEVCSSCHVSLGISETGDISSTHMHGSGAVPYNKMATIVLVANEVAKEVFGSLAAGNDELSLASSSLFT